MPVCKNCGARLSKLDNDICPVCGTRKPLEGVSSETVEITSQLDAYSEEFKNYKPCKRMVAFILSMLIGFTGFALFYLRLFKIGIIYLVSNILLIAGLFSIFFFAIQFSLLIAIVITIAIIYGLNIAVGLYFLFKNDLKDGRGEFVR